MNWDSFFDDLSSQLESELEAEVRDVATDETRVRLAQLTIRDRLCAMSREAETAAGVVRIEFVTGHQFTVHVVTVGRNWCSADVLEPSKKGHIVFPIVAINKFQIDSRQREQSLVNASDNQPNTRSTASRVGPRMADQISFAFVLRDLCRRRRQVVVYCQQSGQRSQSRFGADHDEVPGVLDHIGADHLDIAESALPMNATSRKSQNWQVIPLHRIAFVQIL